LETLEPLPLLRLLCDLGQLLEVTGKRAPALLAPFAALGDEAAELLPREDEFGYVLDDLAANVLQRAAVSTR
jgi:hypothetical protein